MLAQSKNVNVIQTSLRNYCLYNFQPFISFGDPLVEGMIKATEVSGSNPEATLIFF